MVIEYSENLKKNKILFAMFLAMVLCAFYIYASHTTAADPFLWKILSPANFTNYSSTINLTLNVSSAVLKYLTEKGYNPSYGARPLKRLIQSKILAPIASAMIENNMMAGGEVTVDMKGEEFVFDVKKFNKKNMLAQQKKNFQASKKEELVV